MHLMFLQVCNPFPKDDNLSVQSQPRECADAGGMVPGIRIVSTQTFDVAEIRILLTNYTNFPLGGGAGEGRSY